MGKLFWIALGAAAGVLVVRKATKTAQAYTPEGMASSLSNLGDAIRDFADAVREGMAEREEELRVALGIDAGVVDAEEARRLIENPSAPRD
jgi:Family of unknown function (DUF6167)